MSACLAFAGTKPFDPAVLKYKIGLINAPLFVIHGKSDPRVPYTEAEQVVKALKDRGAIVEYRLFDDEGHVISKTKNWLVLYPLVADFLDKYMKYYETKKAGFKTGLFQNHAIRSFR